MNLKKIIIILITLLCVSLAYHGIKIAMFGKTIILFGHVVCEFIEDNGRLPQNNAELVSYGYIELDDSNPNTFYIVLNRKIRDGGQRHLIRQPLDRFILESSIDISDLIIVDNKKLISQMGNEVFPLKGPYFRFYKQLYNDMAIRWWRLLNPKEMTQDKGIKAR